MKPLLISPDGMLGRAWSELLRARGIEAREVAYPAIDLGKRETIDVTGCDVVINCAAFTDVDGAEEREDEATAINGTGVGWLAEACAEEGALLVHYGTDYVFSGDATAPYPVDGELSPVNAYGRSKAAGEVAIRESGAAHLILRTSWLYAPWGKNFVLTMKRLGAEKEKLRVVNDQRGRPTSAEHLAESSLRLVEKEARGTLHVTDGGECTWFELASHVVKQGNPSCVVEPCGSEEYPRPAKRPAYSVLDLQPTEALIGAMPDWRTNVDAALARA